MSTSNPYPGPWEVQPSQYEAEAFDVVAPGVGAIAIVANEDNAKVMAAAPDLLKALQELEEAWTKGVIFAAKMDQARNAIKRATT